MSAADEWLAAALATGPADRAGAEAGVRAAYAAAELPEPERYVWCDSPHAGALAAAALVANGPETTGRSVRAAVRTRPWARARADATERLGHTGWSAHWAATSQRNWRLVTDRLVTPLRASLDEEFTPDDDAPALGGARLALLDAVYGQHDGAWLAAHDQAGGADEQAGGDGDQAGLGGLAQVARSAGWWWPYERVVVLTERPVALHRDNLGRLHHGDGPALSYPDGWSINAWRGMPIPAEIAAELPTVTAARIQAEENAEMRRVMLEFYGFERYLRESGAKRVHSDECGVLWRVKLPDDEPLVMVEVLNSTPEPDGTRRTYFLRVPPQTERAREGVAWTFGLTEAEYQPLAQT